MDSTSKVTTGASVSLDGYIAGPGESGFEHLFAYMSNGDVEVPTAQPTMTLRMTPENAQFTATSSHGSAPSSSAVISTT
jgi:hypothetical protein